jgi:hypothetical protein
MVLSSSRELSDILPDGNQFLYFLTYFLEVSNIKLDGNPSIGICADASGETGIQTDRQTDRLTD